MSWVYCIDWMYTGATLEEWTEWTALGQDWQQVNILITTIGVGPDTRLAQGIRIPNAKSAHPGHPRYLNAASQDQAPDQAQDPLTPHSTQPSSGSLHNLLMLLLLAPSYRVYMFVPVQCTAVSYHPTSDCGRG